MAVNNYSIPAIQRSTLAVGDIVYWAGAGVGQGWINEPVGAAGRPLTSQGAGLAPIYDMFQTHPTCAKVVGTATNFGTVYHGVAPVQGSPGTWSQGGSRLYLFPWTSDRGGTIDQVALYVSTPVGGSKYRIQCWPATSESNPTPAAVAALFDAEVSSAATGWQTANISFSPIPRRLYWFGVWTSNNAQSVKTPPSSGMWAMMGTKSTDASPFGTTCYYLGGAIASYPAGPVTYADGTHTNDTVGCPIAVRYSA